MPDWRLLWPIIKNLRAEGVNRKQIGYTVAEEVRPVSAAEAADFGAATGDPNPAYAVLGGPLPPLYLAKLMIPFLKRIWQIPDLHMNLLHTVHAEQSVRWHRPLHSGELLHLEATLTDIRPTEAGELVEISGRCVTGGMTAVEGTTGLLVRRSRRRPKPSEPADGKPAERFRVGIFTWEGQQHEYAKVSGDRNVIHTSEWLARAAGLPRTILHGACVLAMACTALTEISAGGDIDRIERIACRFSRPVIPGRPLTLVGTEHSDPCRVPFFILDAGGRLAVKNGLFCCH